jgi:hypothetical protein
MKSRYSILFILFLIIGLLPINFSVAITQNQINAEVHIVCPDDQGNIFSGSGTFISSTGAILTNKHVVTDLNGETMQYCWIGLGNNIENTANFKNDLIAETKYVSTDDNLDLAVLFILNNNQNEYNYINIQESTSAFLTTDSNNDAIGYPAYNDYKLTKTNGKCKVKNWFENMFGANYPSTVLGYVPGVITPKIEEIPESHNYGKFNDLDKICYLTFEDDSIPDLSRCFDKSRGKSEPFNEVQFSILKPQVPGISDNGIRHIYYKFDTSPNTILNKDFTKYSPYFYTQNYVISDKVSMDQQGIYYFSFFIEDNYGNISDPYIYEYIYESENFKKMTALEFYEDNNLKNHLLSFDVDYFREVNKYEHRPLECKTRLKNLTVSWMYPTYYQNFAVHSSNSWGSLISENIEGEKVKNKHTISNIHLSSSVPYNAHYWETPGYLQSKAKYIAFYLKPITLNSTLDYHHHILSLIYESSLNTDLICRDGNIFIETDNYIDWDMSNKLKGKILLQVEQNGEAYYIYPDDLKRYYLGRPKDAFNVMRNLGLGATHDFITSHTIYPTNVLGKILLDVEQNGEAYYIYPKDKKAYYLGRPADAFRIMRELGLGITNYDLNKIPEGNL